MDGYNSGNSNENNQYGNNQYNNPYGSNQNQGGESFSYGNAGTNGMSGQSSPYQSYNQNYYGQYGKAPQNDAVSIVGMVLGIISIPAGCCYGAGIIFAIIGLICSIIGMRKNRSGYAIAGILTSAIGFIIAMLIIAAIAAFVRSGAFQEIYWEIYQEINDMTDLYDLFIR